VGVWCNYFYNKVFSSTVICVTTPLAGIAYLFSMMFRPDFSMQPIAYGFRPQIWLALIALLVSILVLTAIAVAASTRLGQVMTLCVTVGVFLLGLLSDWFFGMRLESMRSHWLERAKEKGLTETATRTQIAEIISREGTLEPNMIETQIEVAKAPLMEFATLPERLEYAFHTLAYSVVPNFQVLWLSDAVTQQHRIPPSYVGMAALYGGCFIIASLGLATLLFQRREVG
jgi:ABC-2 type transport system permease protein